MKRDPLLEDFAAWYRATHPTATRDGPGNPESVFWRKGVFRVDSTGRVDGERPTRGAIMFEATIDRYVADVQSGRWVPHASSEVAP